MAEIPDMFWICVGMSLVFLSIGIATWLVGKSN